MSIYGCTRLLLLLLLLLLLSYLLLFLLFLFLFQSCIASDDGGADGDSYDTFVQNLYTFSNDKFILLSHCVVCIILYNIRIRNINIYLYCIVYCVV